MAEEKLPAARLARAVQSLPERDSSQEAKSVHQPAPETAVATEREADAER